MRLFAAILVAIVLSGCEEKEAARVRNEQLLPPGCKIIDLDYGDLRAAVVCDGRKSTTQLRSWEETTFIPMTVNNVTTMTQIVNHYAAISAVIE